MRTAERHPRPRTPRSRRLILAAVLPAIAVVSAACGGGGSTTPSAGSAGSAGSTASTSPSGTAAVNTTAMRTVLLRAGDFPTGWAQTSTPEATASEGQTEQAAKSIAACRQFVAQSVLERQQTKLTSSTFADSSMASGSANEASNQVVGYATETKARAAYAVYAGSETSTCLQQVFDKMLSAEAATLDTSQGTPTIAAEVQRLGVPAAGDATAAYQITVTITVAGQSQQLGFIVQIVRVGQYVVSYNATMYAPAPDKFGENLVSSSIARFQAALGA